MVFVRSSLYLLFMAVTVVLYSVPLALLGWVLPLSILGRIGRSWGILNLRGLRWICGLGYQIDGREHLPSGPAIVLCKHQSTWETIALRAWLAPEHTWVLKRELLRIPFFGWGIAPFQPIAIDRKAGRKAVKQLLEEGRIALDAGRTIVVFPEGTRVAPGTRGKYGIGGALLAEKTGVPVVPIAHNAGVFWRRRGLHKYPGRIDVVVGPPMDTSGLSAQEINRRVEAWIEERVAALPARRGVDPG
jgi:1-acyl-sn-glycerol-3-phosphate acyltransferase